MDWSPDTYCAARKGPWLQAAINHRRFLRRIQPTEMQLGDIFKTDHRERMRERFSL
jgi:hypothetical protein